jgi:hypothetical protein
MRSFPSYVHLSQYLVRGWVTSRVWDGARDVLGQPELPGREAVRCLVGLFIAAPWHRDGTDGH